MFAEDFWHGRLGWHGRNSCHENRIKTLARKTLARISKYLKYV